MAIYGKSVVVTGGASGIGLGITRYFAKQSGVHVTILDIDSVRGSTVVTKLRQDFPSGSFSFEHCDVSSWSSQAAAFANIYEQQRHIDIVFPNAGITEHGSLLPSIEETGTDRPPSEPDLRTLTINLVGVIYSIQLAIYYMKKGPRDAPACTSTSKGLIVCTASSAGLWPFPVAPVYAASKSGIVGLVRSLARPLQAQKIRINALAPAFIETNIVVGSQLFEQVALTPMDTATKAVSDFVESDSSGCIAVLHGDNVTMVDPIPYVDNDTMISIEKFWDLLHS